MEKQKATEQSSLTSEGFNKSAKENINKHKIVSEIKQNQHRDEYSFMDGVLGCVKI